MKRFFIIISLMVLVFVMVVAQGCQTAYNVSTNPDFGISEDDFVLVGDYLREIGASEISVEAANEMNHSLKKNSESQEIKSTWQFLVDFVQNGSSEEPVIVEFGDNSTLTIRLDSPWEDIGG